MSTYVHTYMCMCAYTFHLSSKLDMTIMHTCMYVCMYVCTYVYTYIYIYMFEILTCLCVVYTYTHKRASFFSKCPPCDAWTFSLRRLFEVRMYVCTHTTLFSKCHPCGGWTYFCVAWLSWWYTHICIHICTHTHTHMYMHVPRSSQGALHVMDRRMPCVVWLSSEKIHVDSLLFLPPVCVNVFMHVCVLLHMHKHVCWFWISIYIYIYIYTYTHTL
jgi:hypothetical protein